MDLPTVLRGAAHAALVYLPVAFAVLLAASLVGSYLTARARERARRR